MSVCVSVRVLAPSQWKEDLKKEKIQDNEKHQPEKENNNKKFSTISNQIAVIFYFESIQKLFDCVNRFWL